MSSTGARPRKSLESRVLDSLLKADEEFTQSLKVFGNSSSGNVLPGESSGGALAASGEASNSKITNLGLLTSPFVIDFALVSDTDLVAEVDQNTPITFTNIPLQLFLSLRLYIRSVDPIITIDGTIVSGVGSGPPVIVTAVDDFLDISLSSIDQINVIIGTVKKNDKTEEPPGLPLNVQAVGNSPSTINVIWDPPITGTQPIIYDVAFSLSSAGSAANGPNTHASGSPDNDLTSNEHNITGLVSATTYYVWIRAKNSEGNSDWLGPFQTNTEGITTVGALNFAIPAVTILYDSITCEWDQPGGALFSLTRTNTVTGEVEQLQDFDVSDADVVDSNGIDPNTNYDYRITVFNGFGFILGAVTINVTSAQLPAPVFVMTAVGRKLKSNVTFPPEITLAEIDYALDSLFTDGLVTESFPRPIGNWTISSAHDHETNEKNPETTYYGRVRFKKVQEIGPNAATQNVTTGTLLTPSQPSLRVTSPDTGQIRIKVHYVDDPTRDEIAVCTWRDANSVGEFFDTIYDPGTTDIASSYSRNSPPPDDLNSNEDRVEVIRDGAWSPGQFITVKCVCVNASGTSPADTDNILVDT